MTPIPVKIIEQGAPVVHDDSAYISHRGENIAAIVIDLASKRCEFFGEDDGEKCLLYISTTEDSLHLKEESSREVMTLIELPEFAGWRVFLANICKYTLRVCVVREADAGAGQDGGRVEERR